MLIGVQFSPTCQVSKGEVLGKFGVGSESGFCSLDSASLLDVTAASLEEPAVATELEDVEMLSFDELDSEPATGEFANGVLGVESLHAVNAKDAAAIAANVNPQLLKRIFPPILF